MSHRDLVNLADELRNQIFGQDRMLERILVCAVAGGHCLLEGAPGLAKTLALRSLSDATDGTFSRIQFTPDLMPMDILGTRIWKASKEEFETELGPIFANFVLADEINRSPAKVQAALLEVMEERQVTLAHDTHQLPDPFFVLATQNPIESEGVYPLPEAQRDRFLMRVIVDHPDIAVETRIALLPKRQDRPAIPTVMSLTGLLDAQRSADAVNVTDAALEYSVSLVAATRGQNNLFPTGMHLIEVPASPRATQGLITAAKALALLRGSPTADVQEVYDVAFDVLNHRLMCTYDALADGHTPETITVDLLKAVPAPSGGQVA